MTPLFVGRNVAYCLLIKFLELGRFEDSVTVIVPVRSYPIFFSLSRPALVIQKRQGLDVPVLRIATIGLGLDIVPPHEFLALAKGPRTLAGHCTRLTGNTAIQVEYRCKLEFRAGFIIRVAHLSTELPIIDLRHLL
jgi:hypothetical protein